MIPMKQPFRHPSCLTTDVIDAVLDRQLCMLLAYDTCCNSACLSNLSLAAYWNDSEQSRISCWYLWYIFKFPEIIFSISDNGVDDVHFRSRLVFPRTPNIKWNGLSPNVSFSRQFIASWISGKILSQCCLLLCSVHLSICRTSWWAFSDGLACAWYIEVVINLIPWLFKYRCNLVFVNSYPFFRFQYLRKSVLMKNFIQDLNNRFSWFISCCVKDVKLGRSLLQM